MKRHTRRTNQRVNICKLPVRDGISLACFFDCFLRCLRINRTCTDDSQLRNFQFSESSGGNGISILQYIIMTLSKKSEKMQHSEIRQHLDDESILGMTMTVPKGLTVAQWLDTLPAVWRPNILLGTRECLRRNWELNGADIQKLTAEINSGRK